MSKIEGISLKIYFQFKDNIFNLCQDIMFDIRFNGSCILIESCKATACTAGRLQSENKEKSFKQTKEIICLHFFSIHVVTEWKWQVVHKERFVSYKVFKSNSHIVHESNYNWKSKPLIVN